MRIAIVKDWRDKDIWGSVPLTTREIHSHPLQALETFKSRCQAWGLFRVEQTDLVILNIDAKWYDDRSQICNVQAQWNKRKGLWNELMVDNREFWKLHKNPKQIDHVDADVSMLNPTDFPKQEQVDWGKYDVVITTNPWLEGKVVRKFPRTVFGYWNYAAHWDYYYSQTQGAPFDIQYDIHCDHIEGPTKLHVLPQSVFFPYPTTTQVIQDFTGFAREPAIVTGGRTLGENRELRRLWHRDSVDELKLRTPGGVDKATLQNGREYFRSLATARYMVYVRNNFGGSGQKVFEAAALGCIVIGYHWAPLFQRVVHPVCKISAPYHLPCRERPPFGVRGCDVTTVLSIIHKLENDPKLRTEIQQYQTTELEKIFQQQITTLKTAISIKRKRRLT